MMNNNFTFLYSILNKHRIKLLKLLAIVLVVNLLDLLFPKILQVYIDVISGNKVSFFGQELSFLYDLNAQYYYMPGILIVFALFRWLFTFLRAINQTRLGQGVLYELRNRIFNTIQTLSFAYHDKNYSGTLISNVVEDVGHVNRYFEMGLLQTLESSLYFIAVEIYMFVICPPAALVSCGLISLAFIYSFIYFKVFRKRYTITRSYVTESIQHFSESMDGYAVVKAYGQERSRKNSYDTKIDLLHQSIFKEFLIDTSLTQAFKWTTALGIGTVLGISILYFRQQPEGFTVGQVFLMFYLQSSLTPRLQTLANSLHLLMRFFITADRLHILFSADEYLAERKGARKPKQHAGKIDIVSAGFQYGNGRDCIKDVSLTIPAGSTIGLVGSTGAGKSTLALLLCRFYDPQTGSIMIDDIPITDLSIPYLRSQFSLVFQDTFLFSDSIRNNIAYGNLDATDEQIIQAAKTAQAHDFIKSFPDGYETQTGEKGVALSGGQRQRLAIARALVREPRFLILDDCTSALDTQTEHAIQSGLRGLKTVSTVIIIAHRFSSLEHADRVFVLDDGKIIEEGTPDQLARPDSEMSKVLRLFEQEGVA